MANKNIHGILKKNVFPEANYENRHSFFVWGKDQKEYLRDLL